jgi:hypothetical protein
MAVQFASSYTQRQYYYTDWKAAFIIRGGTPQSDSSDGVYQKVWFYDGPEIHYSLMWLDGYVVTDPNYSQEQNDADLADFNANMAALCNVSPIEPKASSGRIEVRTTVADIAKNFNLRIFSFVTGNSSSLVNWDSNYNRLSDITITCYDGYGNETTDQSVAVKTVADMEPTFNYELIGGWIDTDPTIFGGTTGQWWISCIGVPDLPPSYGGTVNFVYPANLELVYAQQLVSDGRASQYLTYNPTYHTNKLRWIILHPPNSTAYIQIYIETFV